MRRFKYNFVLIGSAGRINRRIILIVLAVILVLIIAFSCGPEPEYMSSPEISMMKRRGALRVGIYDEVPGFSDGMQGLEPSLGRLFADYLFSQSSNGEKAEFDIVTSPTAGPHLNNGTVDVVLALQAKDSLSAYAYSEPYYVDEAVLIVTPGNENITLSIATIGAVQTDVLYPRLKAKLAAQPDYAAAAVPIASYPDLFAALKSGKINAGLISRARLSQYSYDVAFHKTSFGRIEYALMCSKDSPAFAKLMSILIDHLDSNGQLDEMIARLGLPPSLKNED